MYNYTQKRTKKRYLRLLSLLLTIVIFVGAYFLLRHIIPDDLYFFVGEEQHIHYKIPLNARFITYSNKEDENIDDFVTVDHVTMKPNSEIVINKPMNLKFQSRGGAQLELKLFGIIPLKTVHVQAIPKYELIPCGRTVGVDITTEGIIVLGIGSVQGEDGKKHSPSKSALFTGDMLLALNGYDLKSKEDITKILSESDGSSIEVKLKRQGEVYYKHIVPIKSSQDGQYKLGLWVRDDAQGIGTMTYINPNNHVFGAIGHGITDVDTNEIMPIRDGEIKNARINDIKKGNKGMPGEIEGSILSGEENIIGTVKANCQEGIYGVITNENYNMLKKQPIPIALQNEVKEGKAHILTNLKGNKIEKYEVNIVKISILRNNAYKGMVVEITDPKLLESTNGIIQGMSGSPIIQNGKLIGAVTHVFVQDPTRGYGIFIENMIKNEAYIN